MTPAELGSKLITLSESGQLTAGVGSAAIAETRQEMETQAGCRRVAKIAREIAYACELRLRATNEASRHAAERQIQRGIAELSGKAESFAAGRE